MNSADLVTNPLAFSPDGAEDFTSHFRTFSEEGQDEPVSRHDLAFAAVSCNKWSVLYNRAEPKAIWGDLAAKAENEEISVIFHLGDQVYLDNMDYEIENGRYRAVDGVIPVVEKEPSKYHVAKHYLLSGLAGVDEADWSCAPITELFRQVYRDTWGFSSKEIRRALANAMNVMILNDHDVINNIGLEKQKMAARDADGLGGDFRYLRSAHRRNRRPPAQLGASCRLGAWHGVGRSARFLRVAEARGGSGP